MYRMELEVAYSPHRSPLPHSHVVWMSFISRSWFICRLAIWSLVISETVRSIGGEVEKHLRLVGLSRAVAIRETLCTLDEPLKAR